MGRYLIEGRMIPERIDFNSPPLILHHSLHDGREFETNTQIIKSKIFIHVDAPDTISIPDLRNVVFSTIGDIVNFAGFKLVLGISYDLESITNLDAKTTTVFGAEGFVFDNIDEFGHRLTFTADQFGAPLELPISLLANRAISRATFELRCAIRYHDYTALHCRLAIEAIRNAFNPDDERDGWEQLRSLLNVKRETIESFKTVATDQRHGRNSPQSWEQRRHCMQIAWEIVHRFSCYALNGAIDLKTTPEL